MRTKLFLSFFILAALLVSCGKGERVALRFKPELGVTKTIHLAMKMDMSGMMGGGSSGMEMEMEASMTPLKYRENGDVEMEMMYKRVMMGMNLMGQKVSFDSSTDKLDYNDPKSLAFVPLNALLHNKLMFVMSDKAKIVESPDFTKLIPDSLRAMLGPQANGSDANKMMENMFAVYPEEEIYEGYSWEIKSKMSTAQGPIDMVNTYTVKSITADEVHLDLSGKIEGEVPSMGMTVKMDGTHTGTLVVERSTGNSKKSEMVQDINTKVMGMTMNAKNTITIDAE